MRPSNRKTTEIRKTEITTDINRYAEGSCLIKIGNTHVICTASLDERTPPFLRGQGKGWLTAEYSMLPRATHTRMSRDNRGKPNGRALEIQRLIGRSLRSCLDFHKLGERQILIDCDVTQADGGTRCAAITGGYVALSLAIQKMLKQGIIAQNPIKNSISAISCGIYKGEPVLDLDYEEDSNCDIDANFVLNNNCDIIEIQATAEKNSLKFQEMQKMYELASKAAIYLTEIQEKALS